MSLSAKAPNTATMIAAAAVITRAVRDDPRVCGAWLAG
jgi:hypothetical protein